MTDTNEPQREGLVGKAALDEDELKEVQRLADLCNEHEGLDLKLSLQVDPPGATRGNSAFLYFAGGTIVGFCSLVYGEVCGMVHPEQRRKGVGSTLLEAAASEARHRGIVDVLLICEEASASGKAFVAGTGALPIFGEHHMELEIDNLLPGYSEIPDGSAARLDLRCSGLDDVDILTRLTSTTFGDPETLVRRRVEEDMLNAHIRFFVARDGDTDVGSLKVEDMGRKAGIYGFGVLPEYRGRGFGRQMLFQAIKRLASQGYTRFALEVESTNQVAINLYKSCGFQETTTYGYFRLST